MERSPASHVFVGPTLAAAHVLEIVPDAVLHPPVAHGDLLRLGLAAGDTAVIVDGYFHHSAAVRHKEILLLLAEGVRVVGCSSMGALRAAELHPFGMVGHGVVFDMYRNAVIDSDDEVAVIHGEAPTYTRYSDSLVAFRHATVAAVAAGVIDRETAERVVELARSLSYPARSWQAVGVAAGATGLISEHALARLRKFVAERPGEVDVKAADAAETLSRLDELAARGAAIDRGWVKSTGWRTAYLEEWKAEFSSGRLHGNRVSVAEVLRYRQLYDDDFPLRWRAFVLDGFGEPIVNRWKLTPDSLTHEQRAHWLTVRETVALPADEILALVLTRSCPRAAIRRALAAAEPDFVADEATRRAVAESHNINEYVEGRMPGQSVLHIRETVLRRHLIAVWKLPGAEERELHAAARDRGFDSFADATKAARQFYLRHHLRGLDDRSQTRDAV